MAMNNVKVKCKHDDISGLTEGKIYYGLITGWLVEIAKNDFGNKGYVYFLTLFEVVGDE